MMELIKIKVLTMLALAQVRIRMLAGTNLLEEGALEEEVRPNGIVSTSSGVCKQKSQYQALSFLLILSHYRSIL